MGRRRPCGEKLKAALEDALRYERRKPLNLRTTQLPAPGKRITDSRSAKFGKNRTLAR